MSSNKGKKQSAAARVKSAKARGPGPFKPTVRVPRVAPPAPREPVEKSTPTTSPPVLAAADPGLLERVGREADEALAIGKRVLGMLNVESKSKTYTATLTAIDYNGAQYLPLSGVTQGDTDEQRDGDSLKLKTWEGAFTFARGATDTVMGYAFVQEGPTFLTSVSQVFEAAGTANAPISQTAWDSRLGFRVLKRGIKHLTASDPIWVESFDLKFNHDVQFYNNTATVYEGRVSLYVIADITGANSPTVRLASQLSWVDN